MSRSKDNTFYHRHERHVARNGQTEARYGLKKMGAGIANWGVLGDEIPDVQELVHAEIDSPTVNKTSTKLHLVDSETFENMRLEQTSFYTK
ncbi:hypothetical protein G6F57_000686 [Rhizopus arrhizus]|uniref:Uncharacterized protein n=1 Tax=Rhizopus oryzae TaxID=64495 RepID=A0A9P7BUN7_RHIOR|nr:hypothetical protein G6F23_008479 [Rhizopus arrhizus]KAG1423435.1 hypothetical protein G6F58_002814 [Rhizopus delemar]KAG0766019.1 hypothetical protein G6F24_003943 [Rhizopus arrhizus]KAG0774190.1 hypothetical protein G6F22_014265 [Rhizopus arrhizus]KAG0797862.1 hypothetical protein G6F21_000173 [Rhizopus arrhizus]